LESDGAVLWNGDRSSLHIRGVSMAARIRGWTANNELTAQQLLLL
jgi:hypothetical protein